MVSRPRGVSETKEECMIWPFFDSKAIKSWVLSGQTVHRELLQKVINSDNTSSNTALSV